MEVIPWVRPGISKSPNGINLDKSMYLTRQISINDDSKQRKQNHSNPRLTNKKGKQCLYIKRIKHKEDIQTHPSFMHINSRLFDKFECISLMRHLGKNEFILFT